MLGLYHNSLATSSSSSLLLMLLICLSWLSLAVSAWVPSSSSSRLSIVHKLPRTLSKKEFAFKLSVLNDYNVVLKPSIDDPQKFDSFKVGSARVHRYSRQSVTNDSKATLASSSSSTEVSKLQQQQQAAGDAETEYVMWYHGRCQLDNYSSSVDSSKTATTGNNSNKIKLPPLSTGRIGRATSRNGLVWIKDNNNNNNNSNNNNSNLSSSTPAGSLSEDMPGVSLGLNREAWWGFDTAHVGLGQVLLPMSTPAVLTEGGVYIMYFFGGNFEESSVGDFVAGDDDNNSDNSDTQIQGMTMRIGAAISQDGITWGRVEGDHHTGACVAPYSKDDPNTPATSVPPNMPEELYCAWPDVVVDMNSRNSDEKFLMYYSTMIKDTKQKCIAYAVSPDGFRWMKKGLCVEPSNSSNKESLDDGGCARCCVLKDATYDESNQSWKELDSWTMYYEGISSKDNKHRILWASSRDGKQWVKKGLALDVGAGENDWDCASVGAPHVVRMDDGNLRMYYTGQCTKGNTAIGVAKLSVYSGNTQEWVREQATVPHFS